MGNVSKRQTPDKRADNIQRPPIGLQCSEKIPHPKACFSLQDMFDAEPIFIKSILPFKLSNIIHKKIIFFTNITWK